VLDHDNLSRAIDQTIERIEKSHLRGEDCAIYAELDKSNTKFALSAKDKTGVTKVPRVFPMSNEVTCAGSARGPATDGKSRHFHPASDDPRQFTLLKFYELNEGAIKILLDGNDDQVDLPFTPGPKEHKIIHVSVESWKEQCQGRLTHFRIFFLQYKSEPQRSILLMGRSGTGKKASYNVMIYYVSVSHVQSFPRQNYMFGLPHVGQLFNITH